MDEKKTGRPHSLMLENRESGKLTGVKDIHSFNERLDIASTQRSWEFLKLVLKNCK